MITVPSLANPAAIRRKKAARSFPLKALNAENAASARSAARSISAGVAAWNLGSSSAPFAGLAARKAVPFDSAPVSPISDNPDNSNPLVFIGLPFLLWACYSGSVFSDVMLKFVFTPWLTILLSAAEGCPPPIHALIVPLRMRRVPSASTMLRSRSRNVNFTVVAWPRLR